MSSYDQLLYNGLCLALKCKRCKKQWRMALMLLLLHKLTKYCFGQVRSENKSHAFSADASSLTNPCTFNYASTRQDIESCLTFSRQLCWRRQTTQFDWINFFPFHLFSTIQFYQRQNLSILSFSKALLESNSIHACYSTTSIILACPYAESWRGRFVSWQHT